MTGATLAAAAHAPLVIFGGTFDPVHRAHLAGAIQVSRTLGDTVVHMMPNACPPHRSQPLASGAQRLAMLELALQKHPCLAVEDYELRQPGTSWTVHALQHFRRLAGDAPLVWVLGADGLADLIHWHQWQMFPSLCHLVTLPRPGAAPVVETVTERFPEATAAELLACPAGLRLSLQTPWLPVSSTGVREQLLQTGYCEDVPPEVMDYIVRNRLYNVRS